MVRDAFI